MIRKLSSLRGLVAALAILLALAVSGSRADTLKLKDGRVLDGTVDRESAGTIWFKYKMGSIEKNEMFLPSENAGLERTTAKAPEAAKPDSKPADVARPGETPILKASASDKPDAKARK